MKIRNDYVTNSSSSSYVIADKKLPKIDEETLAKYPFLKNYGKLIEKVLFLGVQKDMMRGCIIIFLIDIKKKFMKEVPIK